MITFRSSLGCDMDDWDPIYSCPVCGRRADNIHIWRTSHESLAPITTLMPCGHDVPTPWEVPDECTHWVLSRGTRITTAPPGLRNPFIVLGNAIRTIGNQFAAAVDPIKRAVESVAALHETEQRVLPIIAAERKRLNVQPGESLLEAMDDER